MDISQLVGHRLGQYELQALLGEGEMSAVYRANQPRLGRTLAVKVLSPWLVSVPGFTPEFSQRIAKTARLEHAHIVPLYDYGIERDISFLVMRLLTGGSLANRLTEIIQERRPLPSLAEVGHVLRRLAGALDYAHQQNVMHGNIKPGAVLFSEQGNVFLGDFDLIQLFTYAIDQAGDQSIFLRPNVYFAPEQWMGKETLPASDQYALGIIFYQIITGRPPFEAAQPMELARQILNETPPAPHTLHAHIPQAMSLVLAQAMAKNPSDRFPTMGAFAKAFTEAVANPDEPATGLLLPLSPASTAPDSRESLHIFLSYSRDNTDWMHRVGDRLSSNGITVWTDEKLAPGTPVWETAIGEAIENAGGMVVLLSPTAKQSEWVARELSYAEELDVRIFPILIEGDTRSSVPFRLVSTQRVDARTDFDAAMQRLVAALRDHLSQS